MVPTMLLSRFISTDLLSMIGFGDLLGFAGLRLGTGVIGLDGMHLIPVGAIVTTTFTSMFTITITYAAPIVITPKSEVLQLG